MWTVGTVEQFPNYKIKGSQICLLFARLEAPDQRPSPSPAIGNAPDPQYSLGRRDAHEPPLLKESLLPCMLL